MDNTISKFVNFIFTFIVLSGYQPTTGQATGVMQFDNFNIFRNAEGLFL